jgi:hypothetical protein
MFSALVQERNLGCDSTSEGAQSNFSRESRMDGKISQGHAEKISCEINLNEIVCSLDQLGNSGVAEEGDYSLSTIANVCLKDESDCREKKQGRGRNIDHRLDKIFNEKYDKLMNWLKDGGAYFSKLEIAHESQYNRIIQVNHACKEVSMNEILLEIPEKFMITGALALDSDIGVEIRKSNYKPPSAYPLISCFLLQEKFLKRDSFWNPWFDVIPSVEEYKYTIPVCFPDEIFERMKGTDAYKVAYQRRSRNKTEYEFLCKHVKTFQQNFTLEQYVWARSVTTTRSYGIDIDGVFTSAIIPLADFLNHSESRETKWSFDIVRKSFKITSTRSFNPCQPVHVFYGSKENSRFLAHYGFSVSGKDQITVSLMPGILITFSKSWSLSSILLPLRSHLLCKRNVSSRVEKKEKKEQYLPIPRFDSHHVHNREEFTVCGAFFSRKNSAVSERVNICSCISSYPKLCGFCNSKYYPNLYNGIDVLNEAESLILLKRICTEQLNLYPNSYEKDLEELNFLVDLKTSESLIGGIDAKIFCVKACLQEKELFVSICDFAQTAISLLNMKVDEIEENYLTLSQNNSPHLLEYIKDVLVPLLRKEGSILEG